METYKISEIAYRESERRTWDGSMAVTATTLSRRGKYRWSLLGGSRVDRRGPKEDRRKMETASMLDAVSSAPGSVRPVNPFNPFDPFNPFNAFLKSIAGPLRRLPRPL